MGVWGPGLYSGDFARDLKAAATAVARLPFEGDRLLDILVGIEPHAANSRNDEDHTTFWLVVADQFAKCAIISERARAAALKIIDEGHDIELLRSLGMEAPLLKKRQTELAILRARITSSANGTRRAVLKKPQPFIMNAGEMFVYPTCGGQCINSYFSSKHLMPNWKQDGWGAMVIIEVGRAFDFLAWYRPLILRSTKAVKPLPAEVRSASGWVLRRPGPFSAIHFKRMELEKIGAFSIDPVKVGRTFSEQELKDGRNEVISDISLVNQLSTAPYWSVRACPKLAQLDAVLS